MSHHLDLDDLGEARVNLASAEKKRDSIATEHGLAVANVERHAIEIMTVTIACVSGLTEKGPGPSMFCALAQAKIEALDVARRLLDAEIDVVQYRAVVDWCDEQADQAARTEAAR